MTADETSIDRLGMLTLIDEDLDHLSKRLGGPSKVKGETDADYRMRLFAFSCLLPIDVENP